MIDIRYVPPRFLRYEDKEYVTTGQEDVVKKATDAVMSGRSLFISGVPGSGKTHLAVRLLYQRLPLIDAERTGASEYQFVTKGIFLPAVDFFLELKSTFNSEGRNEEDVLEAYTSSYMLVLDDIGAEKVSDWSRQMFYTLIDRFYRHERQIIITSNLSLSKLASHIDDRIASRLVEMGECIELKKKDWRVEK